MTGNIVLLAIATASRQWQQALRHIPPILAFLLGVFLAHRMRLPNTRKYLVTPALTCLFLEIVFLVFASFFPVNLPGMLLVAGIALVAAMQNSSFTQLEKWTYNSVMTTGNLRRFAESLFIMSRANSEPKNKRATVVFGVVCLCFMTGAFAGGICTARFHNLALWVPVCLLSAAFLLCRQRQRLYQKTTPAA